MNLLIFVNIMVTGITHFFFILSTIYDTYFNINVQKYYHIGFSKKWINGAVTFGLVYSVFMLFAIIYKY